MQEIIVEKNEAGQRLTKLLMKYLNKAPSGFIYKMLRKKNIKLNGIRAKGDEQLRLGDKVSIYMSDEAIANFRDISSVSDNAAVGDFELNVVYEDDNILIADKPAGILSQKAKSNDYSINEAFIEYLLEKGEITTTQLQTFKPSICNRLDRNTSGLIICGKSLAGSQAMGEIIKNRLVDKIYITIVFGIMTEPIDSTCFLVKNKNIVQIYDEKPDMSDVSEIHTIFEPVRVSGSFTLVRAKLITGKTHQIRAQAAHLGYYIVGEHKYNGGHDFRDFQKKYGLRHHLLHCEKLVFTDINNSLDYLSNKEFICEKPEIFKKIEKDLFN